jgi:hypothetical protein
VITFFYGWYHGAIWSNVLVIPVVAVLGIVWAKTRFWPLRPIQHGLRTLHTKLDAHRTEAREHEEWTVHAIHALHHDEPLPDHPHFTIERTP